MNLPQRQTDPHVALFLIPKYSTPNFFITVTSEKRLIEHLRVLENNKTHFYKHFKETNHIPQEGLSIFHLNQKDQKLNLLETLEIKNEQNSITLYATTDINNSLLLNLNLQDNVC